MMRLPVVAAACVVVPMLLAGCAEPRPLPTPTPKATESVGPTGDGVLRIGALLSMSGDVSSISAGMIAAIEVAVRDVNTAGGVLGTQVETFYRDAGAADDERLESGFADLVARGVDVVIGPASPVLLERLLPLADEAGVAVIATAAASPTARSAEPGGSLLRTVPAVDREVVAIMQSVVDGGVETVALVAGSDAQGQSVVDAARAALAGSSTVLAAVERADAASSTARLSFSVAAGEPDAVVLATTGLASAQVAELVAAIVQRGVPGDRLWFTSATTADYSASLEAGVLEGAAGVRTGAEVDEQLTARLLQSDPRLRVLRFAPETYDAVVLAALAATVADDDGGSSIGRAVAEVTGGEVVCTSAGQCFDALLNGRTINYDGLSGELGLDDAGDVVSATLSLLRYDADNRPQPEGAVTLGE
ncbi:ABC transporter substrate-binding protein [Microcella sp.]|uniref:ABC transporter substrate-binding protein n=1 Tax=Microcella sp. TaxID=1913979 RepID=UPI00256AC961|nr:ABC transporter substrate-binding protein [Microcella sp.]MBX9471821.1 ABC transporter substrate-binding protein [Microcella sp.]